MPIKYNLIAAACENMGIGKNNNLPWRLKTEMQYFSTMTSKTNSNDKMNIVIMGRRTWDSIPPQYKPLPDRINFILSRSKLDLEKYPNVYGFNTWQAIQDKLNDNKFQEKYENIWVIGGSNIYKDAMDSQYFYRLYMTEIKKEFDCDTFFPPIGDKLKLVCDPHVPEGIQEEKDIKFQYKIYENTEYKD